MRLDGEHPDTLDTLHKLAWAVGKLGDWAAAKALLSTVRVARIRVLGAEHSDTIHTTCCHAWVTSQCGQLSDAATAYREVIAVRAACSAKGTSRRWTPGTPSPRRWSRTDTTATAKRCSGRSSPRAGLLGPDHPETLDSRPRYWLACALRGQGRHREARRELRRLLADQVRTLGTGTPPPGRPATCGPTARLKREVGRRA